MTENSRRSFLKTASIGAAGVAAAAAIPYVGSEAAGAAVSGPAHEGPVVAYVKDAKTGDIAVMAGEHEIIHRDPALARQLAIIAARATN
jgi:hypothetical protein